MILMSFSKNLKRIIEDRGLKLTTISEATKIPLSTLSEWTAGREPKVSEALVRLAQFLSVTLDELIMGERFESSDGKVAAKTYIKISGQEFCIKFHEMKGEQGVD